MSDNELGTFLRGRREAVAPADVGLPAGPRRRTPGLRRSELAMLAGVSVEYVTRLEQGRDRHPSPQVVVALAEALRLTARERVHLHRLTKGRDGASACTGSATPALRAVRPAVRAVLDHLDPAPAVLLNRLGELLAWTDGFDRLTRPVGLLDAPDGNPPNLARYVLTDERARTAFPDWDRVADQQVAALKQAVMGADPAARALLDDLTLRAGAVLARRLETVTGPPASSGLLRLLHPEAGELRLAQETLDLPADDDQRLVVHLPADEAASAALEALAGRRPGALRVVAG